MRFFSLNNNISYLGIRIFFARNDVFILQPVVGWEPFQVHYYVKLRCPQKKKKKKKKPDYLSHCVTLYFVIILYSSFFCRIRNLKKKKTPPPIVKFGGLYSFFIDQCKDILFVISQHNLPFFFFFFF